MRVLGTQNSAGRCKKLLVVAVLGLRVLGFSSVASAQEAALPADAASLAEALQRKVATTNQKRSEATIEVDKASPVAGADSIDNLLRLIGLAAGLGLLLVGGSHVVRRHRVGKSARHGEQALEVVESIWVAKGHKLALVAVDGQRVLIGMSGNQMHSFGNFDKAALATEASREVTGSKQVPEPEIDPEPVLAEAPSFPQLVKDELEIAAQPAVSERQRILRQLNRL